MRSPPQPSSAVQVAVSPKNHHSLIINTNNNNNNNNNMFTLQTPPSSTPAHSAASTPTTITPATHFIHQKSYSAYHFPTVNFNSPTPPSTDRTDYFEQPKKPSTRPLHQKAQSESLMRLQLPHSLPSPASLDNIPMLRKKSGELVRSSLKLTSSSSVCSSSSRSNSYSNNSRSAPSTPTQGPKAVHFDAHLEHVRHFLSQQRPIAVSRDGSPIETETEGEEEYPFPQMGQAHPPRGSSSKLVIELPNMPLNPKLLNKVCLTSIELAPDGKNLKGTVLVENLSFEKRVAVRFTFDSWQTVSEVTADYLRSQPAGPSARLSPPCPPSPPADLFGFTIKLQDVLARIEEREMEIAVRYLAAGGEYWDNNHDANYHVRFKTLRNGPPSSHQLSTNLARSHTLGPGPTATLPTTTTTTTATTTTTTTTTTPTTKAEPCPWAVTLRAELDRLVGDDLGVSGMMTEGIVVKKKNTHSASFSLGPSSPSTPGRLDALAAGNQLRAGSGLSARYDFGLSLKHAATHKPSARFQQVFPRPNLAAVPIEWIGISHPASKPVAFLDSLSSTPSSTQAPPPGNAQFKRWSTGLHHLPVPALPPSPPQEPSLSSSSSSPPPPPPASNPSSHILHSSSPSPPSTTSTGTCTAASSALDHRSSSPVSSSPLGKPRPHDQSSLVSFVSGLVTPQSPSLTDESS